MPTARRPRGRPRREEQERDRQRQVVALFRREQRTLDDCDVFDVCPGVQQLQRQVEARLPRTIYKRGAALDLLVQGAAADVLADLDASEHVRSGRLAQFIQAYFFEGRTIVEITSQVFGLCDRATVSSTYRVEAFELVARRFLLLVKQDDPLSVSLGVREAFERQEQHWDRAARRVSEAFQRLHMLRYGSYASKETPPSEA